MLTDVTEANAIEEIYGREVSINPKVSIVVTSYSTNRFRDLADLIRSLACQEKSEVAELVVVVERDEELFQKVVRLLKQSHCIRSYVLYYNQLNGMSDARNKGAKASTCDFIAFVDDDVVLDEGWLDNLLRTMESTNAVAATGPAHPIWIGKPVDWFPKELSWIIGSTQWLDHDRITRVRNVWGSNIVLRKDAFMAIGGFSNEFGLHSASRTKWHDPPSEDVDISIRLTMKYKKPILFVPGLSIGHKIPSRKISLGFVAQRSYSVGYQRHSIRRLYGEYNNLSFEKSLIPRIVALLPSALLTLPKSPRKSMNILMTSTLVLLFATLGFFDRRGY